MDSDAETTNSPEDNSSILGNMNPDIYATERENGHIDENFQDKPYPSDDSAVVYNVPDSFPENNVDDESKEHPYRLQTAADLLGLNKETLRYNVNFYGKFLDITRESTSVDGKKAGDRRFSDKSLSQIAFIDSYRKANNLSHREMQHYLESITGQTNLAIAGGGAETLRELFDDMKGALLQSVREEIRNELRLALTDGKFTSLPQQHDTDSDKINQGLENTSVNTGTDNITGKEARPFGSEPDLLDQPEKNEDTPDTNQIEKIQELLIQQRNKLETQEQRYMEAIERRDSELSELHEKMKIIQEELEEQRKPFWKRRKKDKK